MSRYSANEVPVTDAPALPYFGRSAAASLPMEPTQPTFTTLGEFDTNRVYVHVAAHIHVRGSKNLYTLQILSRVLQF